MAKTSISQEWLSLQNILAAAFLFFVTVFSLLFWKATSGTRLAGENNRFASHGVSFLLPDELGTVSAQLVAVEPFLEPQPGGSGNPAFLRFDFLPSSYDQFFPPFGKYLLVYPTAEYEAFLEANSFGESWRAPALRRVLDEAAQSESGVVLPRDIPVAPVPTASNVFVSQGKVLHFDGGSGVRFLTAYAHDANPVSNEDLLYSFQGLTDDGKHWISLFYPVQSPLLPGTDAEILEAVGYEQFSSDFEVYVKGVEEMVGAQAGETFSPSLGALDSLIESLRLEELSLR